MLRLLRDWGISLAFAVLIYLAVGWLRAPSLPDEAPDFALKTLSGEPVSLSSLRGKTVVLNFWATWCGPCRTEIPWFSKFATENPDVVVLGIATDGTEDELRAATAQLGITYPVLRADSATQRAYGVNTIPTTVVVEPDGSVGTVHVGLMTGIQLELATRPPGALFGR
jgi:thiol-disulfide isomerase/thioredoxin